MHVFCYVFFFFKQKTAYEMRISDWSSDVCSSDLAQHLDAALVGQVDDLDAVLAQPLDPAVEVHRLAHHHRADVELPHQAAAVPARGERGDHDGVAIAALAAGLAEGVGFAVHGRGAFLHPAIVAAAEHERKSTRLTSSHYY